MVWLTVLILILTLCVFVVWTTFIASGPLPKTAEIRQRLEVTAENIPVDSIRSSDAFKIYAVNVVHTTPFKKPSIGYGIYLGRGVVITAAHVVGRWPFLTNPRVLIAGQDLPVTVIKEGSFEKVDLAFLSLDEASLPISLRLRRNPLCQRPLIVGTNVAVVTPEKVGYSRIISPQQIAPSNRERFNSLLAEPEGSGAGVFDADRKCLLGIISGKILKYAHQNVHEGLILKPAGYAGFFIPAKRIANFMPPKYRF
jgi:hypothetical protein